MSQNLEDFFPRLVGRYSITSPKDPTYNCVAWAAGRDDSWWEPDPLEIYYWPPEASRRLTIDAYEEALRSLGYGRCTAADVESGFEKLAIYADVNGKPTHIARQLPDGTWTSKLGKLEDIRHDSLQGLVGIDYGFPIRYMKRPQ